MKKWLSVTAVVVLSLALVIGIACGGGEEEEEGVKEVKLGFGIPFAGATGAVVGLSTKYTCELAAEKIGVFEVGGQRYRWKPYFEENEMSVAGGATSARKLIYEDGVEFMHQTSVDAGMAAAQITEEVGMILDFSAGGAYSITTDYPHTFSLIHNPHMALPAVFDWLIKEHPEVKRVAMTYTEDILGKGTRDAAKGCSDYYGLELYAEVVPAAAVEYYPVATKLMTHDPDLVIGGLPLFDAMWDMGYKGLCLMSMFNEPEVKTVGWDRCVGLLFYMPHPYVRGLWPEVDAFAREYENRFGIDFWVGPLWSAQVIYAFTEILKKAGTVDDVDKIIETMETETFDIMVGSVYYGGKWLNGIGHIGVWPSPIYEVTGEKEYRVVKVYSAEESEAIAEEVYRGR